MNAKIRGQLVHRGVNTQGAHSEMFFKGAKVDEVAQMFKEAPFDRFFETASTQDRAVHADGQSARENPMGKVMGHVDLMHTDIRETGRDANGVDISSTFQGFLNGGARLRIEQEADGVRVRETHTHVRPDLTKLPVAGTVQKAFEESVPVAGAVAKTMRNVSEGVVGKVFEGVHALMAGKSPDRIADSINKKRRTGFW